MKTLEKEADRVYRIVEEYRTEHGGSIVGALRSLQASGELGCNKDQIGNKQQRYREGREKHDVRDAIRREEEERFAARLREGRRRKRAAE